jgi:molybdate transport system regulatory protein
MLPSAPRPRGCYAGPSRTILSKMSANTLRPRLRILHGNQIALGPGKADLLAAIESAGTLAEAAKLLGMSYMRAWKLLQTMNACFKEPLVATARGGSEHGHASLTETGKAVLGLYRRMEEEASAAVEEAWREMEGYLTD